MLWIIEKSTERIKILFMIIIRNFVYFLNFRMSSSLNSNGTKVVIEVVARTKRTTTHQTIAYEHALTMARVYWHFRKLFISLFFGLGLRKPDLVKSSFNPENTIRYNFHSSSPDESVENYSLRGEYISCDSQAVNISNKGRNEQPQQQQQQPKYLIPSKFIHESGLS